MEKNTGKTKQHSKTFHNIVKSWLYPEQPLEKTVERLDKRIWCVLVENDLEEYLEDKKVMEAL